ncbi:MAG: PEGA domain-containing protein [Pseudomonadota bacterium]
MPAKPPSPQPLFALTALALLLALLVMAAPPAAADDEAFVGAQGQGRAAPPASAPAPKAVRPATPPQPGQSPAMVLLDRGEFAAAAGHFEEAQRLWRQCLQLRPGWTVVQRRLDEMPQRRSSFPFDISQNEARRQARLAFVQGVTEFNAQRYDQALEQFHRLLAVFPEDQEGNNYLQLTLQQMDLVSGGSLAVNSQPSAEVVLDGQSVGYTPLFLEWVQAGVHQVEVRGYGDSQAREMAISGRSSAEVSFVLMSADLAVNSQPWAEVHLDGVPQGRTPLTLENLPLGPHQVWVSRPGYQDQEQEVILQKHQTHSVSFTLSPR